MKANIHPQYNTDAKFTCACGAIYTLGSTKKEINIEICSNCHPFYTGQEKVLDVAGRVEKFKARASSTKNTSKNKKTSKDTSVAESAK
jgi:large subunit ribosomal protein L31